MRYSTSNPLTRRQLFQLPSHNLEKLIIRKSADKFGAVLPYVDARGITPTEYFYQPYGHVLPIIDPQLWRLTINSSGYSTVQLNLNDLRLMPMVDLPATLVNKNSRPDHLLMGHGIWRGVPLLSIIHYLSLHDMKIAKFKSKNGYTVALPLDKLSRAILSVEMNGSPLSLTQGFPVRLIVPGLHDHIMPKWLESINFGDNFDGQFVVDETAEVTTTGVILTPRIRELVHGRVRFSGIAYAGLRDIFGIELSIDDADWMPVPFSKVVPGSWTRWEIDWLPPANGDFLVKLRVIDEHHLATLSSVPVHHSLVFRVVL